MNAAIPVIDTLRALETPEGVALTMRVAGPYPRAYAWLIDLLLRCAIYFVVTLICVQFGRAGIGALMVFAFLLEWFWSIGSEVWFGGASPGKKRMGLRVVRTDGLPVGWTESFLRNLLRAADFLPLFYGVGLVSTFLSPRFQRLGDRVAGTMVIHVEPKAPRRRAAPEPPFSPPVPLHSDEVEAITEFAERSAYLTPERVVELADRLEGLTGARGDEGVRRVRGIAAWAEGERAS